MTKDELLAYLAEGTDEATKMKLTEIFADSRVASRTSTLRQQSELDALQSKRQELEDALDAVDKNPDGSIKQFKGYRAWYNAMWPKIQEQNAREQKYIEKYGTLENPKVPEGTVPPPASQLTDEDLDRRFDKRFSEQYASRIAGVIKTSTRLAQRHLLAGRKTEIDMDAIEELMQKRPGLSVEDAYNEWIKPEVEKETKLATEAEIQRRVDEKLQQLGSTGKGFPGGADMSTSGPFSRHADADKFDVNGLKDELARDLYKSVQ
jgi:hypothetical protein